MRLLDALCDALAVSEEFDDILEKLSVLGFDPEEVREALHERIEAHAPGFEHADEGDAEQVAFTQGFVEGLLAASKVRHG